MSEEELLELAARLEEAMRDGLTVDWGRVNRVGERVRIGHRIWLEQTLAIVPDGRGGVRRIRRSAIG